VPAIIEVEPDQLWKGAVVPPCASDVCGTFADKIAIANVNVNVARLT